jgi:DNA-binding response OmpR family regulator
VAGALRAAGHAVDATGDGEEAQWLLMENPYDAAVLDIMMPGRDGVSVTRAVRAAGRALLILLATARSDVRDRVSGLDAGADDYIVKPYSTEELLARLRALQRRAKPDLDPVLRVADLEIDLRARVAGQEIPLTNREFALLEVLAEASPRPVSKATLVERVWDQHFDSGTNVLNVYISYLRKKVDLPGCVPLLQTLRGIGFALREGAA